MNAEGPNLSDYTAGGHGRAKASGRRPGPPAEDDRDPMDPSSGTDKPDSRSKTARSAPETTVQLNVRISEASRAGLDQLVEVWKGRRPKLRDVIEDLIEAEINRRGIGGSS